ncbi:MAG TPA: sigma-70 family RNA polymerase sigma factor, partial [Bacillota bacterium]|nr:sigma-70 family RNA polymerase sigma factor [Bacillota bacterium]
KYNRKPTDEEISKYLGIKKSSVQKVLQKSHMFNLVSFESIIFEKNTDESESSMSEDPYQRLEDAVIYDALKKVVSELSERDKMLITLHYYEGLPLKNIADILGVSESRVSQLHSRILLDMKMALKKITG